MSQNQSSHTPGPWHLGINPGPLIYGPKGEQIADLRGETLEKDENYANVRLIAAAPELLEALRKASCYLEADADDDVEREDYAEIMAALTKAIGPQ